MLKAAILFAGDGAHHDHITDRYQITGHLGLFRQLPILQELARPGHILGRDDRLLALKITLHAKTGEILAQFKDHRRLPALNIARQVRHFRQSRAPIGFDRQLVSRNRLARAAPDTLTAVIFLQPAPQRPGSHRLQFRLDRRADRQAAPEELFFPKSARQLTPNLIGEIAARRQRLAEGRIIAVLHRAQRLLALTQIGGLVDIAVLPHFAQHIVPPL